MIFFITSFIFKKYNNHANKITPPPNTTLTKIPSEPNLTNLKKDITIAKIVIPITTASCAFFKLYPPLMFFSITFFI